MKLTVVQAVFLGVFINDCMSIFNATYLCFSIMVKWFFMPVRAQSLDP